MNAHFRIFLGSVVVSIMLLVSACGPAPNPKLQAKSAEPVEEERTAPSPAAQVEPVAPVEEPRRETATRPKHEAESKQVPVKPAVTPRSANPGTPAPATNTASADPRSFTLPAPVPPPIPEPLPPPDEIKSEPVEPPAPKQITVPSGTLVAVLMIDPVDSETARVGETFKASLDAPIIVDNETIFPRGSEVYVKLAKVQSAGRVSGRSELQLELDRIYLGRKSYLLESSTYMTTGASQTGRTAKSAGLGAAIGAAIGAISGGGKGAVIGGATGAGAGAAVEAIRKGEQVRIDSETRLDFQLEDSLEVTLQSPSSITPQSNNPSGRIRLGTRQ
jgi:hypothetical protein